MYRKFPETPEDAARKVRELLERRDTVVDAINLATDCKHAGLRDNATLDQWMALTAPMAFSNQADTWHQFRSDWDPFSLSEVFGEDPDVETHLANVLWLARLLVEHGKPGPGYDVLLSNLRSLETHKGTELTELLEQLRQTDAFHHLAARLDTHRESFASN